MEDRVTEKELASVAVAPRVTPADLEAEIAHIAYFNAAKAADVGDAWSAGSSVDHVRALGLLTFAVVVLRNGFTVTGQSACASPENYNAEIGQRLALEDAKRQMWALLGFRLRDKLASDAAVLPVSPMLWVQKSDCWESVVSSGCYQIHFGYIIGGRRWFASCHLGDEGRGEWIGHDGFGSLGDAQLACEAHFAAGVSA